MENNTHVLPLPFETGFELPDDLINALKKIRILKESASRILSNHLC